jgi:hypothetical protein
MDDIMSFKPYEHGLLDEDSGLPDIGQPQSQFI